MPHAARSLVYGPASLGYGGYAPAYARTEPYHRIRRRTPGLSRAPRQKAGVCGAGCATARRYGSDAEALKLWTPRSWTLKSWPLGPWALKAPSPEALSSGSLRTSLRP